MSNTKQIILILVGLAVFASVEIYLFDYSSVPQWIPWSLFLIPFSLAIAFFNGVVGSVTSGKLGYDKPTEVKPVNPLEPLVVSPTPVSQSGSDSDLDLPLSLDLYRARPLKDEV